MSVKEKRVTPDAPSLVKVSATMARMQATRDTAAASLSQEVANNVDLMNAEEILLQDLENYGIPAEASYKETLRSTKILMDRVRERMIRLQQARRAYMKELSEEMVLRR